MQPKTIHLHRQDFTLPTPIPTHLAASSGMLVSKPQTASNNPMQNKAYRKEVKNGMM